MAVGRFVGMNLKTIFCLMFLIGDFVEGFELNSIFERRVCYKNVEPDCNEEFIHAYPHLSKSATNSSDADTFFWLFTRKNPEDPENLHKCAGKLPPNTNFNPENDLIVILNPFIVGICDAAFHREWVHEMLKRGDYNVMTVDYSWGNEVDYETARLNIRIVAKQTVIVLRNIQEQTGITYHKISLVAISLGGQLAGLIGKDFHVKRITALDPAGPGFAKHKTSPDERLDPSDADFVEVWHCNGGPCLPYLGIDYDAGHVNFYINGGKIQSACHKYAFTAILKKDFIYGIGTALFPNICYHAHCAQYYRASINPGNCQFVGVKCDSYRNFKEGKCHTCGEHGENCLIMGFDTYKYKKRTRIKQKYYLDTTEDCPYCDNSAIQLDGYSCTYKSSLQSSEYGG